MKLVFGINYEPKEDNSSIPPEDCIIISGYPKQNQYKTPTWLIKPVPDSILLTREQFNELVEDIARKFQLSSVNNSSQFTQQYLSSLNSKEK